MFRTGLARVIVPPLQGWASLRLSTQGVALGCHIPPRWGFGQRHGAAGHSGFTEEELDFILNYDIKYRLSRSSDSEDE